MKKDNNSDKGDIDIYEEKENGDMVYLSKHLSQKLMGVSLQEWMALHTGGYSEVEEDEEESKGSENNEENLNSVDIYQNAIACTIPDILSTVHMFKSLFVCKLLDAR